MQSEEIRKIFLDFFKNRNHSILPSASLVPENDPSVLFNTAGMQPLVPFLMGKDHPAGRRLANIQKCVRTQDIDEVGDATHDTFFEMMGNWSLGDYFKEEAIYWSYELLTSIDEGFGLDPERLYITVFAGDANAPRDEESFNIWRSLGIPEHRIYFMDAKSNWWSPGDNGPCGPDTEIFYDITEEGLGDLTLEEYLRADDNQQVVEIWNNVFMEYEKRDGKVVGKLSQKNVDTGAGLERFVMALQGKNNIFETDLFSSLMESIESLAISSNSKSSRIIADHLRTSIFMIGDGVTPSNTDRGYILRRLLRRAIFNTVSKNLAQEQINSLVDIIINKYQFIYPELQNLSDLIKKEILAEADKFTKTLKDGLREFDKLSNSNISGPDAFKLFTTYGFPIEMTKELAENKNISIDLEGYAEEFKRHQELSRQGAEQKFKGGLADNSEKTVQYHTTTHLLHQALREVLGDHVSQKGSNITAERLRFDFTHTAKMTEAEKKAVESIVNDKISKHLPVNSIILPKEEAERTGALHFFGDKYGDQVSIYYIGENLESAYSKEFCGGPHVTNTMDLGRFKILKEEAVASGVRRIKAVLE
ncbi:MAG TPA: alanine--tRNA ligase [Candidatus Paceibacterota bacterium]